jgi:F-type H+-transporting ATPase subunit delta
VADLTDPAARVYAEALRQAAVEAGRLEQVNADLAGFTESLAENRRVASALFNPQLPREAKERIVVQMLDEADQLTRNAVLVLIRNGRLPMLLDLQAVFAEMAAEAEQILDVELTTAVALDDEQVSEIERRISSATGVNARLTARVDPQIIGGLVLKARGVLLDASVKRELDNLRRALVNTPLPVGSEA